MCSSEKPAETRTVNHITTGSSWNHIGRHGGLDTGPWLILAKWTRPDALAFNKRLKNHPGYQTSFFQDSAPEWVEVDVKSVYAEHPRRFGEVWLALELLKTLNLDQFFQEALGGRQTKIPWEDEVSVWWWPVFVNLKANFIWPSTFATRRP
jgi:hypothetical protein